MSGRAPLPTLKTDRLVLPPWGSDHLKAMLAMDADLEVMRYVGAGGVPDPVKHHDVLSQRLEADHGPGLGDWSVVSAAEPDRFLGWQCLVRLRGYDDIELGYRYTAQAWGKGYATEASQACLAYAFDALGLDEVVAVVHPDNHRSQRVIQKLGFLAEGRRWAYGLDLLFYRLPRNTYAQRKPNEA